MLCSIVLGCDVISIKITNMLDPSLVIDNVICIKIGMALGSQASHCEARKRYGKLNSFVVLIEWKIL